jgi:hypothetical protein
LIGAPVIRRYLTGFPGYFPEPAGTVEGPSGRQILAFCRGDLWDFGKKRTGDGTGVVGRKQGPGPTGPTPETQQRIDTAVTYLREIGGHRRGVAAELAKRHGEPTWKWERIVRQAREALESGTAVG